MWSDADRTTATDIGFHSSRTGLPNDTWTQLHYCLEGSGLGGADHLIRPLQGGWTGRVAKLSRLQDVDAE